MGILSFMLYLIVAAICAGIADFFVPGGMPGGFLVSAIIGIIGAWIGTSLFGYIGPSLAGVALLPAIMGSGIFIFFLSLIRRGTSGKAV